MPTFLSVEGLSKLLQKIKAVFATKTELNALGDSLTAQANELGTTLVHKTGNETIAGTKTFSSTISGSIDGNAGTATKLAAAKTINGVSFDGSANITVADSTKLPLAGGTMTGNITMSASKSIVFDLSASTPTASTVRNFPIQFKSQSTGGDFAFAQNPFWEIPSTQTANNGMGVGFGAGALTIIGGGEAGKSVVSALSLTGTNEKVVIASDGAIEFYTNCNTIANRVATSINTSGNFTGKAANVTGTVAIANGGTGATTRLNAAKALSNENVGTGATHFITMTTSWGKFGYSTTANVKSVLGISGSDRRIKDDIEPIPDAVLDAWDGVEWKQFRLKKDVAKLGKDAPLRTGAIVQEIQDALGKSGVDCGKYGFIYREHWEDEEKDLPSEDNPEITNSEKWYLKYEDALVLEAAYLRRRCRRLEERIAALEAKGE